MPGFMDYLNGEFINLPVSKSMEHVLTSYMSPNQQCYSIKVNSEHQSQQGKINFYSSPYLASPSDC